MTEKIYLTQYGLMAERHWREFRQKMVHELEAKGTLMEALFEAQETTINEMEALPRQLETEQKLTPQQAHDQALYLAEVLKVQVQELFPPRTPGNRIHDFMEKLETTRF